MVLQISKMTKPEMKKIASSDSDYKKFIGDIEDRDIDCLRALTEMFFSLYSEVFVVTEKNGF